MNTDIAAERIDRLRRTLERYDKLVIVKRPITTLTPCGSPPYPNWLLI